MICSAASPRTPTASWSPNAPYRAALHAIPGSPRCIQCHMGSPSQSFVLGFTPRQINRRPQGVGGTLEATGPDELTQLQRFIDAGIVTGIDSPDDDVLPLEGSQGSRVPRNDYELVAQGYMLGNCAHCHNPRGFPTIQNPVLANVLDFLPGPNSGIFQFPLERYSPRIGRGLSGSTPIPYITPSLVDLPRLDPASNAPAADVFELGSSASGVNWVIYAPWRSIIYRNVESAFAYTDDLALYPHMPMNTPGYDIRARQILSDWMVSIPAARKHPELVEYGYQTLTPLEPINAPVEQVGGSYVPVVDWTPQPYAEVPAGAPQYANAVADANARLQILHTGVNPALPILPGGVVYSRYADPMTARPTTSSIRRPCRSTPSVNPIPTNNSPSAAFSPYPLPEHAHWVITDLTDPPGPWGPANRPTGPTCSSSSRSPRKAAGTCPGSANQDQAYSGIKSRP